MDEKTEKDFTNTESKIRNVLNVLGIVVEFTLVSYHLYR